MKDINRTKVKLHPMKCIEVDTPANKYLVHYVGISLVICALALFVVAVRWW